MILLSRFILKGISQAALVAASMAVLAVIPLLGWVTILISGAAVALMTLVHGYRHGLLVMLAAALGTGCLPVCCLASR
jgi:fatty acid desaturase